MFAPWRLTLSLLVALVIVLALIPVFVLSGDRYLAGAGQVVIGGEQFALQAGEGAPQDGALAISRVGPQGAAAAVAQFPAPVQAADFTDLTLRVGDGAARDQIRLAWVTTDDPGTPHNATPDWEDDRTARLPLEDYRNWAGEIGAVAVIVQGSLQRPLVLQEVALLPPKPGVGQIYASVFGSWAGRAGWTQRSINFLDDPARQAMVSPVTAAAAWIVLASVLLVVWHLLRARSAPLLSGVLLFVVVAWLLLDLRWQASLLGQHGDTLQAFAGLPVEERANVADDSELHAFTGQVRDHLPEEPVRLISVSGSEFLRERARYHLLPHRVYPAEDLRVNRMARVQSGDYLLMLGRGAVGAGGLGPAAMRVPDGQVVFRPQASDIRGVAVVPHPQDAGRQALELEAGENVIDIPGGEGLSQGFYEARFRLASPGGAGEARLRIVQHGADGSTKPVAVRDILLGGDDFEDHALAFLHTGEGRLSYRVVRAPAGLQVENFEVRTLGGGQQLAFVANEQQPPYLVVTPLLQEDGFVLFRVK